MLSSSPFVLSLVLLSLLTFLFFYEQYLQNDKLVERVTVSLHKQTNIIPNFKWAAKFPSFIVWNSFVFLHFSGDSLMKDVLTMMVKLRLMTSSNLSRPTNFLLLQNSMMRWELQNHMTFFITLGFKGNVLNPAQTQGFSRELHWWSDFTWKIVGS